MPAKSVNDIVALCKRRGFIFTGSELSFNPEGGLDRMEMNQAEFGIVKALLEKLPVCFLPYTFLCCPVLDKFYISDQSHRVPAEEIANTGSGICFKMSSLTVNGRML